MFYVHTTKTLSPTQYTTIFVDFNIMVSWQRNSNIGWMLQTFMNVVLKNHTTKSDVCLFRKWMVFLSCGGFIAKCVVAKVEPRNLVLCISSSAYVW